MQVLSIQNNKSLSPSFNGKVTITNFNTKRSTSHKLTGAADRQLFDCFSNLRTQCSSSLQEMCGARLVTLKPFIEKYLDKIHEITGDKSIKKLTLPVESNPGSIFSSDSSFSVFSAGGRYTVIKTKDFSISHDLTK
ncbi:MAG: hypothetical protein E7Z92_03955 [Cyanobacteria bacterium SIG31]|nr:hypothetical protein [Cyanobacteria bacterium SIG31]